MNEDDKLREIFSGFEPDMQPDSVFMSRLERNIEQVELIKRQLTATRSRSRRAVVAATFTGFVFGVLSTAFYSHIALFMNYLAAVSNISSNVIGDYSNVFITGILATVGVFLTYSVYDLAKSRI